MAERLYYEFQNDKAITYRVSIHDESFVGTATEINCNEDGFVLKWEGKEEELYVPICASNCTFPIVAVTDTIDEIEDFIDDLATGNENRFTVGIYKDPDDTNTLFWAGVILADQTEYEDNTPFDFVIVASDDLGNLKGIDYTNDGTPYEGQEAIVNHLLNCLNKTRSAHFWATDDTFLNAVDYINNYSGVLPSITEHDTYTDIGFVHEEMYDTNQNGIIKYKSAYEILEGICSAFMLTMVQSNGVWWALSRRVMIGASKQWQEFKKDGTFIQDGSNVDFTAINNTTGARRLTGFRYAYLNAAHKVEIEYNFLGNIAVINSNWDESNFGTLTETSDAYIVPSGEKLVMMFPFRIIQEADGTRTGDDRALRYKLIVSVKCGDYYLKRNATIGNSGIFTLDDGTQLSVFQPNYNSSSWTVTDTDTMQWFSGIINAHDGDEFIYNLVFETPALPEDSLGIEVTVDVEAYDAAGNTSGAITTAAFADAVVDVLNTRVWIGDGSTSTGNSILFYSEVDNDARDVMELNTALLGDNVSTGATRGSLRYESNGEYVAPQWAPQSGALRLIHQQVTFQHLSQRAKPTRLMRGTLYFPELRMTGVMFTSLGFWSIYSMTYNANLSEWDIEAFAIKANEAGITVAEGDRFDTGDSDGGSSSDTGSGLTNGFTADTNTDTTDALSTQIAAIRPAGEAGAVMRNAVDDTYTTTLRGVEGITSDTVLTLPTNFFSARQAAAPLSLSGTTYYMPVGGGIVADTSVAIQHRYMVPFDCEVTTCVIMTENAAGSTGVKLYVNDVEVDSLTPTLLAGTPLTLNFTGNDVDTGDTISISVNGTNAPGDTYFALNLRIK